MTFRGYAPDEDVLYFIRRCAQRLAERDKSLDVTIERGPEWHEVQLSRSGRSDDDTISERDPDVFLAVRNAFGRLALAPRGLS